MQDFLMIYCGNIFDGQIYVKILCQSELKSASITLIKNGQEVDQKDAVQNFARFKKQEMGTYKSKAILLFVDDSTTTIESDEIVITHPAVMPQTASVQPAKGGQCLYANFRSHYLELKIEKGGLARLKAEAPSLLPLCHTLIQTAVFKKISLRAF